MKEFLKDYATLIGPTFAFLLGVLAIYIKFYSDRTLDKRRSRRKLKKLIALVRDSAPPPTFYPNTSADGLFHADQARNMTNASIFLKKINVLGSFIATVESDILTNCEVLQIQQFMDIKFIIGHLTSDVESYRQSITNSKTENGNRLDQPVTAFMQITQSFQSLINVCDHPSREFRYIAPGKK